MFKLFYFFVKLVVVTNLVFSKDIYQSVRLYNPSPSNISIVGNLGVPLDHVGGKRTFILILLAQKSKH